MGYGHAPSLADRKPDPVASSATAVRRPGAWARANPQAPGLAELHGDFTAILARIRELGINQPEEKNHGTTSQ